ncbi:MAG TPA: AAA family ATPase [Chitinophagaceae bacterium]|nr:AAA family ATPase [Chitinophagaceae bacterium]
MELQQAQRKKAKIKMGISGPSGGGKTYSALLLAFGLTGDWSKIVIVDTENNSAHLYAHLGAYNVLPLSAPFNPEKYIEAIRKCVTAGMEVIIIDSISHEWEGNGGILDIHSQMTGNSFTAWSKLTPRHNAFVQELLQNPVHVIANIRTKQDYVLTDKNGKMVPEKVGLRGITREGLDYEFTLAFDLDIKHNATASKDRTSLFIDKPEFKITTETGKKILEWCNSGVDVTFDDISKRIGDCKSLRELLDLYKMHPQYKEILQPEFETQKRRILVNQEISKQLTNLKPNTNGSE